MVSEKGMSTRFGADSLRPMGRATSGVIGMRFRGDDRLLAMDTVRPGSDLVTVTDGGFAKRTPPTGTPRAAGGSGCRPCVWCRNRARWSARSSANRTTRSSRSPAAGWSSAPRGRHPRDEPGHHGCEPHGSGRRSDTGCGGPCGGPLTSLRNPMTRTRSPRLSTPGTTPPRFGRGNRG